MTRSFRHRGVERFFRTGSKAGIQTAHAPRLARQRAALNVASQPTDMNAPGWGLHPLKGKLSNHWSVSVGENWRLTFTFRDGDAELVDYEAAAQLGVDRTTLSKVLNGRAAISPAMALRIERWLGRSRGGAAEAWLAQQTAYDLWRARETLKKTRALAAVRSVGHRAA